MKYRKGDKVWIEAEVVKDDQSCFIRLENNQISFVIDYCIKKHFKKDIDVGDVVYYHPYRGKVVGIDKERNLAWLWVKETQTDLTVDLKYLERCDD